jgi:hypothetical protein
MVMGDVRRRHRHGSGTIGGQVAANWSSFEEKEGMRRALGGTPTVMQLKTKYFAKIYKLYF